VAQFWITVYFEDVCVPGSLVCVLLVDTPDETDKTSPDDDLQKNLAFLLDRVEGCSVSAASELFLFSSQKY